MKRIIKKFLKCLIIYVVIFMTNISYGYTVEDVGSAVAKYTKELLEWGNREENYCDGKGGYGPALRYSQGARLEHPTLADPDFGTPWFYDCSSFVAAMYNMVCNQEIFGWDFVCGNYMHNTNLVEVSAEERQPGDIICSDEHVEIYISKEDGSGGAHQNFSDVTSCTNADNQVTVNGGGVVAPPDGVTLRLTDGAAGLVTDLDGEFSVGGSSSVKSINYSKFFFNGIPDGKYSLATRKTIIERVIDKLKQLVNYLTSLLTYIFRGAIISFISVFDRLLNSTIESIDVEITNMENKEKEETEDPDAPIEDTPVDTTTDDPQNLKKEGVTATNSDDPISINRSVTIEGLLFNDLDLFDINIFE